MRRDMINDRGVYLPLIHVTIPSHLQMQQGSCGFIVLQPIPSLSTAQPLDSVWLVGRQRSFLRR